MLQCAGEHKGHAGKAVVRGLVQRGHVDAGFAQLPDQILPLLTVQPVAQETRCDRSDVVDRRQFLLTCALQCLKRTKVLGQHARSLCANLTDAQGTDQTREVILL